QPGHDLLAAGDEAAGAAAERRAEAAADEIDAIGQAQLIVRAAPVLADDADALAVVDGDERVVLGGQAVDVAQVGGEAREREDAVGDDDAEARRARAAQAIFEVLHVLVAVRVDARAAEPHAVGEAGADELVAEEVVAI